MKCHFERSVKSKNPSCWTRPCWTILVKEGIEWNGWVGYRVWDCALIICWNVVYNTYCRLCEFIVGILYCVCIHWNAQNVSINTYCQGGGVQILQTCLSQIDCESFIYYCLWFCVHDSYEKGTSCSFRCNDQLPYFRLCLPLLGCMEDGVPMSQIKDSVTYKDGFKIDMVTALSK